MRTKNVVINLKKALARRAAKAMLADVLYQELRGINHNLGAAEAMRTVKAYDKLTAELEQDNLKEG